MGVYFAVLGMIVGSFLNVLIARHGTGKTLGGRSSCDACGRQLGAWHLIPVVSWMVLGGRCAYCRARLSVQYPLVELLTGVLFVGVALAPIPLGAQILATLAAALLVAIAVYDYHHTIIPDAWVLAFNGVALMFGFWAMLPQTIENWMLFLASGLFAALPIFTLWLVSRGAWMGLGDAKLALGIGWLLGPYWGVAAIFGGFVIGAVVSVFILLPLPYYMSFVKRFSQPQPFVWRTLFGKAAAGFTMRSEVPFGPFLICSCFLAWLLEYVLHVPFLLW